MLPVVVVESHQHVLEHIHFMLRRKMNRKLTSWTLIHFDAHPDMACSDNLPAKLCFVPRLVPEKDLYDHLDETSTGIAEWILPLVLAAQLEHVVWIKPSFSHQLPLGESRFQVGVHTGTTTCQEHLESFTDLSDDMDAVVRVDWNHPYYLDDDHVTSDLQLAQTLLLHVKHVGDTSTTEDVTATPWILDICLDYFVCRNPYVHDLEAMDEDFTEFIVNLCKDGLDVAQNSSDYSAARREFFRIVEATLRSNGDGQELCRFLECDPARVDKIHSRRSDELTAMTIEALPHILMPHNAELPSFEELRHRIELVVQDIQRYKTPPFLVTIARSADDGFCPLSLVEQVQDYLLEQLRAHYGSLKVVRDYGEWEGSSLDEIALV